MIEITVQRYSSWSNREEKRYTCRVMTADMIFIKKICTEITVSRWWIKTEVTEPWGMKFVGAVDVEQGTVSTWRGFHAFRG